MKKQTGFAFIELLVTFLVVSALAGVSIAVYAQYQERAFSSIALQQGLQLRTGFEAGLAGQSALGANIFNDNLVFSYDIDAELSCTGCDTIIPAIPVPATVFPGFVAQRGLRIFMNTFSNQTYQIYSGHCRFTTADNSNYEGWLVSDQSASVRIAFATAGQAAEVEQCQDVIAGSDFTAP